MRAKTATVLALTFLAVGSLILAVGVILPIVIRYQERRGLQDIWLHPDDFDTWGQLPGKMNIRLLRNFKLLNYTNPEQVFKGARPAAAEAPGVDFLEIGLYKDWFYQDALGNDLGQDIPGPFIAYHYQKTFELTAEAGGNIDLDIQVTGFNYLTWGFFYAMTHFPVPLLALPNLYDVKTALETDLYDMAICYAIFETYMKDAQTVKQDLSNSGFSAAQAAELLGDQRYGWTVNWKNLKLWVQAVFELRANKDWDGAVEGLKNHFQVAGLEKLLVTGGYFAGLVVLVESDMEKIYGTSDRSTLGLSQWVNATVTRNLPLVHRQYPHENKELPDLPTFIQMNATFNFLPELYCLNLFKNGTLPMVTFTVEEARKLLTVEREYPQNNTNSVLNHNGIISLLVNAQAGNWAGIAKEFALDPRKAGVLAYYLGSLAHLPLKWENQSFDNDGYSMLLSRWSHHSFIQETNRLRHDVVWGLPAMMLLATWKEIPVTCQELIEIPKAAAICAGDYGWDIDNFKSWTRLSTWVEAANKTANSASYKALKSTGLTDSELQRILSLVLLVTAPFYSEISQLYECSKDPCTYDQLFHKQWGGSSVSLRLPHQISVVFRIEKTVSFYELSTEYLVAPEWSYYSGIEIPESFAMQLLTYEALLNPTTLRVFYNEYFAGDLIALAQRFHFPDVSLVEQFYNYFHSLIPGLQFFSTRTIHEWLYGSLDPFLDYVGNTLNIYQGGYPLVGLSAFSKLLNGYEDKSFMPYDIIYSGLGHSGKTSFYYKYYGEELISSYARKFDSAAPTGFSYGTSFIWPKNQTMLGGEGATFGLYIDKDETYYAFISALLVNVPLKYEATEDYKDVEVYTFTLDPDFLLTSQYQPENSDRNQFSWGLNGFINISNQAPGPTFVSAPRCYLCEKTAQDMVEYYEWDPKTPCSRRIYADKHSSESYATVEPLSGVGVQSMLNFAITAKIDRDYYFSNIYEPVPGKGLYIPQYYVRRSQNYTNSQMEDLRTLKLYITVRKVTFYIGISLGGFLLVLALLVVAYRYRVNRFGGWKSRKASAEFERAMSRALSNEDS